MARRRTGPYAKRSRNRNLIVLAVVVMVAAVAIGYYFRGADKPAETDAEPNIPPRDVNTAQAVNEPPVEDPPSQQTVREERPPMPPTEIDAEPNVPSNMEVTALIGEALALMAKDPPELIQARDTLNKALELKMNARQRMFVKQQLESMARQWLFTRDIYPSDRLCSSYKVQPGDQLSTICSKYKVPYEIIMVLNNIARPELLQAGQTLKMIHGPFHATINRSTFTMDLFLQDAFVQNFRVGIGKPGRETPTGLWCVKNRMVRPPWTDPDTGKRYEPEDPDYPLGARWIGLEGLEGPAKGREGFAIHGTKEPDEIGAAVSRGCIRMYNDDVTLVYDLLVPGESMVRVVD